MNKHQFQTNNKPEYQYDRKFDLEYINIVATFPNCKRMQDLEV